VSYLSDPFDAQDSSLFMKYSLGYRVEVSWPEVGGPPVQRAVFIRPKPVLVDLDRVCSPNDWVEED
jgi:hypothetical protein